MGTGRWGYVGLHRFCWHNFEHTYLDVTLRIVCWSLLFTGINFRCIAWAYLYSLRIVTGHRVKGLQPHAHACV